jgi:hypothetical protein
MYKCDYCDKSYGDQTSLNIHKRKIHGIVKKKQERQENLHKCNYCDKSYENSSKLYIHNKQFHKQLYLQDRKNVAKDLLNLSLNDSQRKKILKAKEKQIIKKLEMELEEKLNTKEKQIIKKLEMELEEKLNTKEKVTTKEDWANYMKNQKGNGTENTSNFIIITGILLVCSWVF